MAQNRIARFYDWAWKKGFTYNPHSPKNARYIARPFNNVSIDQEIYIFDTHQMNWDHSPVVTCTSVDAAKVILQALNRKAETLSTSYDEIIQDEIGRTLKGEK